MAAESDEFISKGEQFLDIRPSRFTGLIKYINSLQDSHDLCDITIRSRGQTFRAHKVILAGQSTYFRKLFTDNFGSSDLEVDFDPELFSHCINFIYKGNAKISCHLAGSLGKLCNELGIDELKYQCWYHQISRVDLSVDNCIRTWISASYVDDAELIRKARGVIKDNFDSLQTSPALLNLPYENVKILLTHPEILMKEPDACFISALEWVRSDTADRGRYLVSLLEGLPLAKMGSQLLKHTMRIDPLLKSKSEACDCIQAAISGDSGQTEHCSFMMGIHLLDSKHKGQPATNEVHVVSTSLTGPSKIISSLPTDMHESGYIAACVDNSSLYVSGIGPKHNEVWELDLKTCTWKNHGEMAHMRNSHCMCSVNGDLFIIGGIRNFGKKGLNKFVEVRTRESKEWKSVGLLAGSTCTNTCCCPLSEQEILVFGVEGSNENHTLQVYDIGRKIVEHSICLPEGKGWVYSVCVASDHVIMVSRNNIYRVPVSSVRKRGSEDVEVSSVYKLPTSQCAVLLNESKTHLVILGGKAYNKKSQCLVYRAPVEGIINNTGSGWEEINLDWSVGACLVTGGTVCTGRVPASVLQ